MLFDFGLQVGYSITEIDSSLDMAYGVKMDSIATKTYYDQERSVYYVSYIPEGYDDVDVWIEGIGSLNHSFMYSGRYLGMWDMVGVNRAGYFYDYNTREIFPVGATPHPEFTLPTGIYSIENDCVALTLRRTGYVLMAVFPAIGAGEMITLCDVQGRVVTSQAICAGATMASIGVDNLPAGLYIVRLTGGATAKVVL